MAQVNLQVPFESISGTLNKRGIINRRKLYRDDNGKVIFEGRQEAYAVRHPRDYRQSPPQGEELNTINRFREAHRLTLQILRSADYSPADLEAMTAQQRAQIEALQAKLLAYKARFRKQLGKTADPAAPVDRNTRARKHYHSLNTFIRAMLTYELKEAANQGD